MSTDNSVTGGGYRLFLLTAAMAVGGYVQSAVSPLQETMRIALSLSDNQVALLQGPVMGVPLVLGSIPLGILIDRYSRSRLLFVLVVLSLIASLLTACAPNFTVLMLARALAGLTGLGSVPVVFSLLADLYPPGQRGRVTTLATVGQVAGSSAAFALGGTLLTMAGSESESWRWAMLWLTVPILPIALAMLRMSEPARTGVALVNPSARQVWEELRHHRAVIVPLVIGIVLVQTAVGAMLIWGAPMLSRNFGLAQDRVGTIMAIGLLVSGTLGPGVGGTLADICHRLGGPHRAVSVLCMLALLSAPAGLFGSAPGVVTVSILLIGVMTLMLAIALMGITLVTIVIPNEVRGLCMSVLVAVNILFSVAVAPVAVSMLSGALGGPAMIGKALSLVCVTACLLAAVTFAFTRRYLRPLAVAPSKAHSAAVT